MEQLAAFLLVVLVHTLELFLEVSFLFLGELQLLELLNDRFFQPSLSEVPGLAILGVAAVVDVTLVSLADQAMAAEVAMEQSAEQELVLVDFFVGLAGEDFLDAIVQRLGNDGLMLASK